MTGSSTTIPAAVPRESKLRAVGRLIASRNPRGLYQEYDEHELAQAVKAKLQQNWNIELLAPNDKVQWYRDLYDLCYAIERKLSEIQARPYRCQESKDNACAPWEELRQSLLRLVHASGGSTAGPLQVSASLSTPLTAPPSTQIKPASWCVHYQRKDRDYRGPLIDLLEAWRAAGRAKPTAMDVLAEWARDPPQDVLEVDARRGFRCKSGGKVSSRFVGCAALAKTMRRLIRDIE